jgi:hypothetical protein
MTKEEKKDNIQYGMTKENTGGFRYPIMSRDDEFKEIFRVIMIDNSMLEDRFISKN